MINFSVPNYYSNIKIILCLLELQEQAPYMFLPNHRLDSSYGFPPGLIWNGGRASFSPEDPQRQYEIYDTYKNLYPNFKIRHTCTNAYLTEDMFLDTLCNRWVEYTENEKNSIIIYNDKLKEYIQKKYPKYNFVHSITKGLMNLDLYNEHSKNDMVVVDYNFNTNHEFLSKLKHPENIELICAEPCVSNCPDRFNHWNNMSKIQLNIPGAYNVGCTQFKHTQYLNLYTDILHRPHALTNEAIDLIYEKHGICNMKISGRTNSPYLFIESLLYYLIKPEYRDTVRQNLLIIAYHNDI